MASLAAVAAATIISAYTAKAQQDSCIEIKQRICAAAQRTQTMECDFVQTKRNKMLKDAAVMSGHLVYKQPESIYWRCETPNKVSFATNGQNAKVSKDGKTTVTNLSDNKIYKRIKRMAKGGLGVDGILSSDDFASSITEENSTWVVTLTPKRKELKQIIEKVTLHADPKDAIVKTVDILGKNGDRTTMEFKNIRVNETVDTDLFSF